MLIIILYLYNIIPFIFLLVYFLRKMHGKFYLINGHSFICLRVKFVKYQQKLRAHIIIWHSFTHVYNWYVRLISSKAKFNDQYVAVVDQNEDKLVGDKYVNQIVSLKYVVRFRRLCTSNGIPELTSMWRCQKEHHKKWHDTDAK